MEERLGRVSLHWSVGGGERKAWVSLPARFASAQHSIISILATTSSIQLDWVADVLAFGAEAQTTSGATQHSNIIMDVWVFVVYLEELS